MLLAVALSLAAPPPAAAEDWEVMIDAVVPAVVTIKVSATRPFDTEGASTSTATGFVVDAARGILLTNRHVVEPGPVVAEAIFSTHEEVPLRAIYRDPVHDFGFYQFDPAAVKFQAVTALELRPDHARVGAEIRVVGSDNAEKLAILSGTVARLDREAPRYGGNRFNDFNTFYLQAASGTSGGSSGSPVLDVHGHAIALNAGAARGAATSFFLPLDRVTRALERIRADQPVTRGGLQAVFAFKTFDEVRRLGLRPETEAGLRAAGGALLGCLVVDEVIPRGPADGKLAPGDVVLTLDGLPVRDFVTLEEAFDTHVGGTITLGIERGGAPMQVALSVEDLHGITPSEYLEFGGGVLNRLSFQQARNHTLPVRGVYVASPGWVLEQAGVSTGSVIVEVGRTAVDTVADFEAAVAPLADGQRVPIRFFSVEDPRRTQVGVIRVDRRWFPMNRCRRDDRTGVWPCTPSPGPAPRAPVAPGDFAPLPGDTAPARTVAASLVWVRNTLPFRTDGVYAGSFSGTGVVVDAARGYVLVDRDTVPVALGDVSLTFGGAYEVPATILAVHPFHNLALVRYNPALVAAGEVRAVSWSPRTREPGDRVWHVGLAGSGELHSKQTRITRYDPLFVPIPSPPGFRDANLQVYDVDTTARASGGVLVDRAGRVAALFASFVDNSGDKPVAAFRGVDRETIDRFLAPFRDGSPPVWRTLGAELLNVSLPTAMQRGLGQDTVDRLLAAAPDRREVLQVWRRTAGSAAAAALREGDLVLAVDGLWAPTVAEVERAAQHDTARLTVFRVGSGNVEEVDVAPVTAGSDGHDRFVGFAGALVQPVPRVLASQRGFPAEGLYVAWHSWGSPASRYGLTGTLRIRAVDDRPVATLDELLAAVDGRPDRSAVRVRVENLDGRQQVLTLKLDLHYWPTFELVRTGTGWERRAR